MLEVKVTIAAPDLSEAIKTLAEALTGCQAVFPQADKEVSTPAQKTAPAPVQNAPVQPQPQAPVNPPQSAPVSAPQPQDVTPVAPAPVQQAIPAPQPQQAAPVQATQVAAPAAPAYTLDQLANAGAALLEKGMMDQLMGLLAKYGVQAVTQLKAEQYSAFVNDLRTMGAAI